MFTTKTVCRPGAFIEVVPAGLLATIRYNQHGILDEIRLGYEDDAQLANPLELKHLSQFVPNTIPISGGTTWVKGAFYSESALDCTGYIPHCMDDAILSLNDVAFYAGYVTSRAAMFSGALTVRNWLNVAKFNSLPGMVVPLNFNAESLKLLMLSSNNVFKYPYISGYMIYEGPDFRYEPEHLIQAKIKSVYKYLTSAGYLMADIKTDVVNIKVNYSDVVRLNLQTDTAIVVSQDDSVEILLAYKTESKVRQPVPVDIACPICKKLYRVPAFGPVCCDDPNCTSKLYPVIQHMLRTFSLPEMSEQEFLSITSKHEILCLTDVLKLPAYKDIQISSTLASAIHAVTPPEVCNDDAFFVKLEGACNSSVETFLYYVDNPIRIRTDLDFVSLPGQRFIEWLQQDSVALTLRTILSDITLTSRGRKFEGDPIFRNVKIAITGQFKRGDYDTISSILSSYSAEIVPDITAHLPNLVITGSLNTGIDGAVIHKARNHNIPIYTEDEFFANYEIDADIAAANLL